MMILTFMGLIMFLLSFTTGYYAFGKMHSVPILICLFAAVLMEGFGVYAREKWPEKEWPHVLMIITIVLLCWGIGMIFMDRIEAVGNTVITDFDAGHGGEEAVYISLVAVLLFLSTVILGIVKSFFRENRIKVVELNEN